MHILKPFLLVGIGGLFGSMARYGLHLIISSRSLVVFPWGTFTVNISGCLLIGLLIGLETRSQIISDPLKWLVITGFCGGFTTFSTFSAEGFGLLQQQQYFTYIMYVGGSVFLGLLATVMGFFLVRSIT